MKKSKALLLLAIFLLAVLTTSLTAFAEGEACAEHSFGEYVSDGNATCRSDGTKTAVCSVCGAKETVTDEGSRIGHAMEQGWKTNKLEHWKRCRSCGGIIEASVGSHIYAVTHEREATRNSEGLDRYECTFCHYTYTAPVPKLIGKVSTGAVVLIAIGGVSLSLLVLILAFRKPRIKRK